MFTSELVGSSHAWRWQSTTPAGEFDQSDDNLAGRVSTIAGQQLAARVIVEASDCD